MPSIAYKLDYNHKEMTEFVEYLNKGSFEHIVDQYREELKTIGSGNELLSEKYIIVYVNEYIYKV